MVAAGFALDEIDRLYELLGVAPGATREQIRDAYFAKVDQRRGTDPQLYAERVEQAKRVYAALSNDEFRQWYEHYLGRLNLLTTPLDDPRMTSVYSALHQLANSTGIWTQASEVACLRAVIPAGQIVEVSTHLLDRFAHKALGAGSVVYALYVIHSVPLVKRDGGGESTTVPLLCRDDSQTYRVLETELLEQLAIDGWDLDRTSACRAARPEDLREMEANLQYLQWCFQQYEYERQCLDLRMDVHLRWPVVMRARLRSGDTVTVNGNEFTFISRPERRGIVRYEPSTGHRSSFYMGECDPLLHAVGHSVIDLMTFTKKSEERQAVRAVYRIRNRSARFAREIVRALDKLGTEHYIGIEECFYSVAEDSLQAASELRVLALTREGHGVALFTDRDIVSGDGVSVATIEDCQILLSHEARLRDALGIPSIADRVRHAIRCLPIPSVVKEPLIQLLGARSDRGITLN